MPKGRRTAQTSYEKDEEYSVEKVLAKKYMKIQSETSSATQTKGKRPFKTTSRESVLHYEIKWADYEETTWEPA